MTIDIKTLSKEDLKQKIENIKAEREKTAEALKRYEEELEARKTAVPLGVPAKGVWYTSGFGYVDSDDTSFAVEHFKDTFNCFPSKESATKHAEMMIAWRKALVDAAYGNPIDIEVLKPFLRRGWVAMDKNGQWCWFNDKPLRSVYSWKSTVCFGMYRDLEEFDIKPVADWTNSLQECGL